MGLSVTVTVKDGATNKDIAAALRHQAGLIEGLAPKVAASRENTDATPPKGKKVRQPVEEEETFETDTGEGEDDIAFDGDETEETEEVEDESPKILKADVIKALQAFQKSKGRDKAIAAVKKFAKSGSVNAVAPTDYPKLMKLIGG